MIVVRLQRVVSGTKVHGIVTHQKSSVGHDCCSRVVTFGTTFDDHNCVFSVYRAHIEKCIILDLLCLENVLFFNRTVCSKLM